MNHKNALLFIKQSMLLVCLIGVYQFDCLANDSSGIRVFTSDLTCQNKANDLASFRTFSIMDVPAVMAYINHYECNGELGAITIYATEGDDLTNLEISLDGGENFTPLLPDNFNNLILLHVEAGQYELYVRMIDDRANQRYVGLFEVLKASEVDTDNDGFTKCEDVDDRDPCVPQECDLAQGIGCDLSIEKSDYEWCHFEDLLNPQQLSIGIKVEDIEGYASYQWSNGDTSSTLLVSPISDTYFHVSVSDQSGCVLSDSVFVDVTYIPFLDAHIVHQSCAGTLGSIVLFSPIGESLMGLQISLDNGETFQEPSFDNFGNVVLFGLELGEYSITIRHKDQPQCVKELGVYEVADEQFFDADEDGIIKCEDSDDDDPCVPIICENCDELSVAGFESTEDSWEAFAENVELSGEEQRSGEQSVKLSSNDSYIESESLLVDNQRSVKISLSVLPRNLEANEGLSLSMSSDGGSTFHILNSWYSLIDFHNDDWFDLVFKASIEEGISELQFRLSQSSSDFNDYIFIDDVTIEFCENEYMPTDVEECSLIHYDDVDAFQDFWSLGGDNARVSTNHAQSGQFSYHLQNGNGASSSIISGSFSTDGVGDLTVEFSYTPVSMELREFFALELSLDGGTQFNRLKSWVSGEFINDSVYQEIVTIPINRSTENLKLKFTNYGNSQFDHVYLDDIKIEYCEDVTKRSDPQDEEVIIEFEKEKTSEDNTQTNLGFQAIDTGLMEDVAQPSSIITVYPNPTTEYINLSLSFIESHQEQLSFRIIDISGHIHLFGQVAKQKESQIDVSMLPAGSYVVLLFDEQKLHLNQALIKI